MTEIRPLTHLNPDEMQPVIGSYTCQGFYQIQYRDSDTQTLLELVYQPLPAPVVRRYDHFDAETMQRYQQVCSAGYSWGAYQGTQLVGLLISEPQAWNESLWVWEFHVAEAFRGQGIGRRLMEQAAEQAQAAGLRIIVCETQNRNAAAIQVYRKLGFRVEGIDISYYTNQDYPDRDIAVFMKRRLTGDGHDHS